MINHFSSSVNCYTLYLEMTRVLVASTMTIPAPTHTGPISASICERSSSGHCKPLSLSSKSYRLQPDGRYLMTTGEIIRTQHACSGKFCLEEAYSIRVAFLLHWPALPHAIIVRPIMR
jgi:hypothetical protein